MADETLRVVADTSIFLQATISVQGPASAILRLAEAGRVILCNGEELKAEIRDVLTRPALRRKNKRYSDQDIENFIQRYETLSLHFDPLPASFRYERDPKDEHIINLALAANAPYIVTRDKDLLDLMDDSLPEGQDFRARFPTLTILDPVDFLNLLASLPEPDAS